MKNQLSISFDQVGDKVVTFSLKTASKIGLGKVTVTASSGSLSATYDIELDVRPSNPDSYRIPGRRC